MRRSQTTNAVHCSVGVLGQHRCSARKLPCPTLSSRPSEAKRVQGEPGVEFPEEKAVLDVVATSRDDVVISWVEEARDDELIVSVPKDRAQRDVRLDGGERL